MHSNEDMVFTNQLLKIRIQITLMIVVEAEL